MVGFLPVAEDVESLVDGEWTVTALPIRTCIHWGTAPSSRIMRWLSEDHIFFFRRSRGVAVLVVSSLELVVAVLVLVLEGPRTIVV